MCSFLTQQPDKVVFFSDPGHGWLRVKRAEIDKLDLMSKISPYSYQSDDGHYVYLEEDCDLARYADALKPDDPDSFTSWFRSVPRIYDDDEILRNSLDHYQP